MLFTGADTSVFVLTYLDLRVRALGGVPRRSSSSIPSWQSKEKLIGHLQTIALDP